MTLGFLATAALPGLAQGWRGMALWSATVCFSLIAHELAHATIGLASGSRATIVMYPLGGATTMVPPLTRGRSIVAHLAGPLVSLMLGLAAAGLRAKLGHLHWLTVAVWVNLGWAGLNLIPVPPFDGGYLLRTAMGPERSTAALAIAASVATGVAITGLVVVRSFAVSAVFGGIAVYSISKSVRQRLEWIRQRLEEDEARVGVPARLHDAELLLANGRPVEAQVQAAAAVKCARTKSTRRRASELLAWCLLGQDRPGRAREVLIAAGGPLAALDAHCRAAVEEACGHEELALEILEHARRREGLRPHAIKRLVDLHARRGRFDLACRVTHDEIRRLHPDDVRRVIDAALKAGAFASALKITGALFDALALPEDGIAWGYALEQNGDRGGAIEVLDRLSWLPVSWPNERANRLLSELGRKHEYADVVRRLLRPIELRSAP